MDTDSHAARHRANDELPDFVWPPPDADIDALVVVDLSDKTIRETAAATLWVRASETSPALSIVTPPPPRVDLTPAPAPIVGHQRPSRRLHLWAIGLGLVLVQWAEFGGYIVPPAAPLGQPPPAPTEHAATHAGAAGSGAALAAAPALPRDDHGGDVATPSLPRRTGTRSRRRGGFNGDEKGEATKPALGDEKGEATKPALGAAATLPLLSARSNTRFVPPRALGPARPVLGPAPFPAPRGARTSLELVIDETGQVNSARVSASGAGFYDHALVAAARQWRFEPATFGGRPTRAVHIVHVPVSR